MVRRTVLVSLMSAISLLATGCASTTQTSRVIHPSYAEVYDTVDGAANAADVVVLATAGTSRAEEDRLSPGLVATLVDFQVVKSLKGSPSANIVVKQDGGDAGTLHTTVDGDPALRHGARYLLFLKKVSGGPYGGDYYMVGGPSGRLLVAANGSVSPEGDSALHPGPASTIDSISAALANN